MWQLPQKHKTGHEKLNLDGEVYDKYEEKIRIETAVQLHVLSVVAYWHFKNVNESVYYVRSEKFCVKVR